MGNRKIMPDIQKTRKILLIEENEVIRLYFRDTFWLHCGQNDYEVSFANDMSQAEQLIQDPSKYFDLIFIDVELHVNHKKRSVIDPQAIIDLILKIRKLPQWDHAGIVLFASPAYFKVWKKAKEAGANYVLKKSEFLPLHLVDWTNQIFNKLP